MDESVEKKIIEESADFSIFSLFLQADVVVKNCNFNFINILNLVVDYYFF